MTPDDGLDGLRILQAVSDELVTRGYKSFMEHPGWVHVWPKGLENQVGASWAFGTVNETWDGARIDPNGDEGDLVLIDIPSDSTDVKKIVQAIARVLDAETTETKL
jgi:hypothetical protein